MYRDFFQMVNEVVNVAHANGIEMFYENLNRDLEKDLVLEHVGGIDKYLHVMFEQANDIQEL